ncbi:hypothetical protein [Rickettsia amblyommatis]|uniref:Uncharacterized protein n=1 Tax=Rickettsia amblyommatis str. Ac/Pa TaxID=1359164 RepID=A0A0F3N1E0_RICAM|nr:hypothetical protein [Rickettsia amblyommatis]KJV61870.1 hypothetical protein APHACPA_0886 [Rickettsia amblyommatis str. Ac/Pa]KJV96837.1 hypothetical protein RAMDARK_0619 [Rickettsia amblyommatis str. Darkwater]
MSTKYYEHAFVLLPTNPTAAYHLWSNYRIQGKCDKANDLIQYAGRIYKIHSRNVN